MYRESIKALSYKNAQTSDRDETRRLSSPPTWPNGTDKSDIHGGSREFDSPMLLRWVIHTTCDLHQEGLSSVQLTLVPHSKCGAVSAAVTPSLSLMGRPPILLYSRIQLPPSSAGHWATLHEMYRQKSPAWRPCHQNL